MNQSDVLEENPNKVVVNIPSTASNNPRRASLGVERQMTSTLPIRRPKYAASLHGLTIGDKAQHRADIGSSEAYATLDLNNVHTRSLLARDPKAPWQVDLSVLEFPRENLHLIEKLGGGQFGEVKHRAT